MFFKRATPKNPRKRNVDDQDDTAEHTTSSSDRKSMDTTTCAENINKTRICEFIRCTNSHNHAVTADERVEDVSTGDDCGKATSESCSTQSSVSQKRGVKSLSGSITPDSKNHSNASATCHENAENSVVADAKNGQTSDGSSESSELFSKIYKPRKIMRVAGIRSVSVSKDKPKVDGDIYYKTDYSLNLENDNRATFALEVDTEKGLDNRSIMERNEKISAALQKGELDHTLYRGENAYMAPINRRQDALAKNKYTGTYGPIRGSYNIRTTLRMDYEPERCKDYFETGYCGWGDTCKFMHDRTDYKTGYQLDKEWEIEQKKKQLKMKNAGM